MEWPRLCIQNTIEKTIRKLIETPTINLMKLLLLWEGSGCGDGDGPGGTGLGVGGTGYGLT